MSKLLFIISCVLFILHQLGWFAGTALQPFADCYLDPLLLMPIILQLRKWELAVLFNKRITQLSDLNIILRYTLSVAFICEVIFPLCSVWFRADILDVAAYFAGALLYFSTSKLDK